MVKQRARQVLFDSEPSGTSMRVSLTFVAGEFDGFGAEHLDGFVRDVAAVAAMICLTGKVHGRKAV